VIQQKTEIKIRGSCVKNNDIPNAFEKKPKLLGVSFMEEKTPHLFRALHTYDDKLEIMLIRKGCGMHIVDGKLYQTKAGDILIYNANVLHGDEKITQEGLEILYCSVADVKLKGLPVNCLTAEGECPVIQDGVCAVEVEALFTLLHSALMEPEKVTVQTREHLVYALLLLVQSAAMRYASHPQSKRVELGHRIQSFIDVHYKEDISLDDISLEMKVNKYYIARVFKSTTGCSPMQYVIRRRIGEAQTWLLGTEKNVTEIAYLVGYNSASNFNNTFHRLVGLTPQKYRENWKEYNKKSQ